MDAQLRPSSGGFEEVPAALRSRHFGSAALLASVAAFFLPVLGTLVFLACAILALTEASAARRRHGLEPERYLPPKTGAAPAILGIVLWIGLPLGAMTWRVLSGVRAARARLRQKDEARAMAEMQAVLGNRARGMRDRFRDREGRVKVPELARALIAEQGPVADPYGQEAQPLVWAPHSPGPGRYALSEGYPTLDPGSRRYVPTLFVRARVLDATGSSREDTWVVRME